MASVGLSPGPAAIRGLSKRWCRLQSTCRFFLGAAEQVGASGPPLRPPQEPLFTPSTCIPLSLTVAVEFRIPPTLEKAEPTSIELSMRVSADADVLCALLPSPATAPTTLSGVDSAAYKNQQTCNGVCVRGETCAVHMHLADSVGVHPCMCVC